MKISTGIDNTIKIYPNPSREDVNISIQLEDKNTAQFILFDYTGKMISDYKLSNGVNQINISRLKSSIYFYKIMVEGKIEKSDKLVVL